MWAIWYPTESGFIVIVITVHDRTYFHFYKELFLLLSIMNDMGQGCIPLTENYILC